MITPKGIKFVDQASNRTMILCRDNNSGWNNWLFFWNANYNCWTSLRRATDDDHDKLGLIQPDVVIEK